MRRLVVVAAAWAGCTSPALDRKRMGAFGPPFAFLPHNEVLNGSVEPLA
jgi:hypothetical protein